MFLGFFCVLIVFIADVRSGVCTGGFIWRINQIQITAPVSDFLSGSSGSVQIDASSVKNSLSVKPIVELRATDQVEKSGSTNTFRFWSFYRIC